MAEIKLTKTELVAMLDAKIQRSAGYKMRDAGSIGSLGMTSFDDDAVAKVAVDVYNDIVGDFAYSEKTVLATRAVRFNKTYVRKIIKAGIKDGSVQMEALVASKTEKALARIEGMPSWLKKKVDAKDKSKGKDGKKKKKGLPPWLKKKGKK